VKKVVQKCSVWCINTPNSNEITKREKNMIDTAALEITYGTEYAKLSVSSSLEDIRKATNATNELIYREVVSQYGQELTDKHSSDASDNAEMAFGSDVVDAEKSFLNDKNAENVLALIKAEAEWSDMYASSLYSSIQDEL